MQNHAEGDLLSTHIVQIDGRTRLVVNLNRMLSYNTKIDGNNLLLTLQSNNKDTAFKNTLRIADAHLSLQH